MWNSSYDIHKVFKIDYTKLGKGRGRFFEGPDRKEEFDKNK